MDVMISILALVVALVLMAAGIYFKHPLLTVSYKTIDGKRPCPYAGMTDYDLESFNREFLHPYPRT